MDSKQKPSTDIQSKGGKARAAALTPERRSEIARQGALAKRTASLPKATHRGNFKEEFGIDVDCYVLDDEQKTGVISKRGMGAAFDMGESGSVFSYFISNERMAPFIGSELAEKLAKPLIFHMALPGGRGRPVVHGYDVTIVIDVCKAILASAEKGLQKRNQHIVKQAYVILNASAKAGIKNLVYALAGYDQSKEEIIAAFKRFVAEEARGYEKEFPDQLYAEWYRLYRLPKPERNKPWKFKALTVRHVYAPLAHSRGKILQLTRAQRAKSRKDRWKKLHQFLSDVGVNALRLHLGHLLGIAQFADTSAEYERKVEKAFATQLGWDF
jgi:general stress protein YciG